MKLKVYAYKNCGTCRRALKFLDARHVPYATVPIREQPPTKAELRQVLQSYGGEIRKLFNTSGQDYKKLNMKETLPKLTTEEAIDLLSRNSNLVKRPFVLSGKSGLVGFDMDEWAKFQ